MFVIARKCFCDLIIRKKKIGLSAAVYVIFLKKRKKNVFAEFYLQIV